MEKAGSFVLNNSENTIEKHVQEEAQPGLEEVNSKLEKNIQDQVESLVNSMKQDIMNKLDEIKTHLSLEITDAIKSQKELGMQAQALNKTTLLLQQATLEKDSLEGVFSGAVKSIYPIIVDYITSGINEFKKKIPQNILDQYPELPAAVFTTNGPISKLFETYSFMKNIPDIKPEESAKSQILKIIKGLRQVNDQFEQTSLCF